MVCERQPVRLGIDLIRRRFEECGVAGRRGHALNEKVLAAVAVRWCSAIASVANVRYDVAVACAWSTAGPTQISLCSASLERR